MNKKYNKKLVNLIVAITAIFLLGCADNTVTSTWVINIPTKISTTSTRVINTPTKISTSTKTPIPTPFPQVSLGTVLVNSLNIRSGPGTNYGVIGSMKRGDEFYIFAESENSEIYTWFLIPLPNNSFGWVIGEPSYVSDKWVTVDYSTYMTLLASAKKAKLIYGTAPTKEIVQQPNTTKASIQQANPTVKPQPVPVAVCTCSNNAYNCKNFSSQSAAQSCYNYCQMSVGYDVHWLDEDGDGIACEWNP